MLLLLCEVEMILTILLVLCCKITNCILQVDDQSLQGFTNHQAVEVLRNTGQMVHLKLARYQRGPKFEKLQQYLGCFTF
jgi:hypothetical protein